MAPWLPQRNRPGFSKSGPISHLGPAASAGDFQTRSPKRRLAKVPSVSPVVLCVFPLAPQLDILPADFAGSEPLISRGFWSPRANRVASSPHSPATPDHKLLSAGFHEGFRKGVGMCRRPGFLALFLGEPSDKPRLNLSNPDLSVLELKASLARVHRPPGEKQAASSCRPRHAVIGRQDRSGPTLQFPSGPPPSRLFH